MDELDKTLATKCLVEGPGDFETESVADPVVVPETLPVGFEHPPVGVGLKVGENLVEALLVILE